MINCVFRNYLGTYRKRLKTLVGFLVVFGYQELLWCMEEKHQSLCLGDSLC